MRKRKSAGHGLPPELAATNHLGKQLDAKRRTEAKANRLLRAEQSSLDFNAPMAAAEEVFDGPIGRCGANWR